MSSEIQADSFQSIENPITECFACYHIDNIPKCKFCQPNLGTDANFVLFIGGGAFDNAAAYLVTGNVGTNLGAYHAFPPDTLV